MPEFDLPDTRVRLILRWVHQLQTGTLLLVGVLLAAAPRSRFGHAWDVMIELTGSRYVLAAIYIASGCAMAWALHTGRTKWMALALRVGSINTLAMAVFLLVGSFTGPTGILGPVFTGYVGLHLLFQSLLLNVKT